MALRTKFKHSSTSDTALHSAWHNPPAAPQPGAVLSLLCAVIPGLLLCGCGISSLPGLSPDNTVASTGSKSKSSVAPPTSSKGTKGQTVAWQNVLRKWFVEWSKPRPTSSGSTTPGATAGKGATGSTLVNRPQVSINVAAIARRHPAWRLADALERGGPVPVNIPAIQLSRFRIPEPVPFGPLQVGAPGGVAGFYRGEQEIEVNELGRLQTEARIKQERAINEFIVDVATRQRTIRTEELRSLRAALQEDIEATRRLSLAELEPVLPSDPVQLEMTNLRLDLLRNINATAQQRAQALARLRELEAQWEAKLRSQEVQRLADLQKARIERPARMLREGEAEIRAAVRQIAQRDAATRQAVRAAQSARLSQHLSSNETTLGITLPAASLPAQELPGQQSTPANPLNRPLRAPLKTPVHLTQLQRQNINKTSGSGSTSIEISRYGNPNMGQGVVQAADNSSSRAVQIRALRAQAWTEARRWAGIAARRAGWHWNQTTGAQSRNVQVPDRTEAVLRILNLS